MSERLHEVDFPKKGENFDTETGLTNNTAYIEDIAYNEHEYRLANPDSEEGYLANNTSDSEIVKDIADRAREELAELRDKARSLAEHSKTVSEDEPTPSVDPEDEWEEEERSYGPGVAQVVNPGDGRIVPYGQMTPGDHPEGGRIVGYK